MNLEQLRARFRVDVDDTAASPQLWSDDDANDFINEAEREAAERALLLPAYPTQAICQIAISDSARIYAADRRIIRIRSVRVRGQRETLDIKPIFYVDDLAQLARAGVATCCAIDGSPVGVKNIILDRTPIDDGFLDLHAFRLPMEDMVDDSDVPEIDQHYHRPMLHWAYHLAYTKRDADAQDQVKADKHAQLFAQHFGEKIDAEVRRQQLRGTGDRSGASRGNSLF